ncbi:MAG: hypothetical protein LBT05_14720, partial [Planctomycetaceae bacterium]|nr:hypothetical protein [Planctomycetaceae bacterium]
MRKIPALNAVLFLTVSIVSAVCLAEEAGKYKGPVDLVPSPDEKILYVLNQDAAEIAVVSVAEKKVVQTYPVPLHPNGFVVSADGKIAAVTCGDDFGKVVLVNLADGKKIAEAQTDHTPNAPVISPDGKRLYVSNRFSKNKTIQEYEFPSLKPLRQFQAVREPITAAITPDGKTLFVGNFLPNDHGVSFDASSEVTTIDLASGAVKNIRLLNGITNLRDLCISPDGKHAFAVSGLARYTLPTTQIERGWMNTAALTVIDVQNKSFVNSVLLDGLEDFGAANPWTLKSSADGRKLYIAVAGTHELCIVDVPPMIEKLSKLSDTISNTIEEAKALGVYDRKTYSLPVKSSAPNDLNFLVGLKKRVRLSGKAPRSVAVIGNDVYLGAYYSDTVNVVDTASEQPRVSTIAVGPTPVLTPARRGELAWYDASYCMQQWQSCASCHPDFRSDGLNWDLMNDGMGNPKSTKSMIYAQEVKPAMWRGVRKDAYHAIRAKLKDILFFMPNEDVCKDIEAAFQNLKPLNSPYLVNGQLSEAAKRGKAIFDSEKIGCYQCHPAETYYSDGKLHNVNTVGSLDKSDEDSETGKDKYHGRFATPQLTEVWRTAPYLHDGRYVNMRDVFLDGKHGNS